MADLGFAFDANEVEPSTPFVALPPGDYLAQIIAAAMEANSAGTGRFLKLELEIVEGDQAGRKFYDRLNLENPNAQAVEIAKRTLSAIGHAVGVLTFRDTSAIEFKRMLVKIATVPRKDRQGNVVPGEFSNEVKGYKSAGGAGPATSGGGQSRSFTPQASSNGGGAGGANGGSAPWKRQG